MATDTQKTNVLFLIEKPEGDLKCEVFAFFKDEQYNSFEKDVKMGYAHLGQHTGIHTDYAKECKLATKEQYNDLRIELEGLGYNLNILNK
jgi:hypothetical protein